MNGLREKFQNKKGFTLVEMLIVVAIIAILIAISIPMINQVLEGARHGVDDANYRDAVSLANVEYLANTGSFTPGTPKYYVYAVVDATTGVNAHQGKLILLDGVTAEDSAKAGASAASDSTGTGGATAKAVQAECLLHAANGRNDGGSNSHVGAYLIVSILVPNTGSNGVQIEAKWV